MQEQAPCEANLWWVSVEEDMAYEMDLERNTYSPDTWLRYVEHKRQQVTHSFSKKKKNLTKNDTNNADDDKKYILYGWNQVYFLYERALKEMPASYKLWMAYIQERHRNLTQTPKSLILKEIAVLNGCYERALSYLHRMPRLWLDYARFLAKQRATSALRKVVDRALQALPVTLHSRVWDLVSKMIHVQLSRSSTQHSKDEADDGQSNASLGDKDQNAPICLCPETILHWLKRYALVVPSTETMVQALLLAMRPAEAIRLIHSTHLLLPSTAGRKKRSRLSSRQPSNSKKGNKNSRNTLHQNGPSNSKAEVNEEGPWQAVRKISRLVLDYHDSLSPEEGPVFLLTRCLTTSKRDERDCGCLLRPQNLLPPMQTNDDVLAGVNSLGHVPSAVIREAYRAAGQYWLRRGQWQQARMTWAAGMSRVRSLADLAVLFSAATKTEETLLGIYLQSFTLDGSKETPENQRSVNEYSLRLQMARTEALLRRRPFLTAEVLIRQRPGDARRWLNLLELISQKGSVDDGNLGDPCPYYVPYEISGDARIRLFEVALQKARPLSDSRFSIARSIRHAKGDRKDQEEGYTHQDSDSYAELWVAFAREYKRDDETQKAIMERGIKHLNDLNNNENDDDEMANGESYTMAKTSLWLAYISLMDQNGSQKQAEEEHPEGGRESSAKNALFVRELFGRALKALPRSTLLWSALVDWEEAHVISDEDSIGDEGKSLDHSPSAATYVQHVCDAYDGMIQARACTPQHILNYVLFLESQGIRGPRVFAVFERAFEMFLWPVAFELWNAYIPRFERFYFGTSQTIGPNKGLAGKPAILMEQWRDLYDRATKGASSKKPNPTHDDDGGHHALDLFLAWADGEERLGGGNTRKAIAVLKRAVKEVPQRDRLRLAQILAEKALGHGGMEAVREVILEHALPLLPDTDAQTMSCHMASLEAQCGEWERARALYGHAAQLADPRQCLSVWIAWEAFEQAHGDADSFREMLRVKRAISSRYSDPLHFVLQQQQEDEDQESDEQRAHLEKDNRNGGIKPAHPLPPQPTNDEQLELA